MEFNPQFTTKSREANTEDTLPGSPYTNKSSKGKWFVIGAALILILIGGTAVFLFGGSLKNEEVAQPNQAQQERREEQITRPVSERYSVLYQYMEEYRGADSVQTLFKSDIEGKNKIELETGVTKELKFYSDNSYFISKNGKYVGRQHAGSIEIAPVKPVISFKEMTIGGADVEETVGDMVWSDDGSKLLYSTFVGELLDWSSGSEEEFLESLKSIESIFYLIDREGTNKKFAMKIAGGEIYYTPLAFSIPKDELYTIVGDMTGRSEEDKIAIFDLSTGTIQHTFKLPETGAGNRFSTDFRKLYYVSNDGNKIIEYDFVTHKGKTIYEETSSEKSLQLPYIWVTPPKDDAMLLVTHDSRDPNYRKIQLLNPSSGEIVTLFEESNPQYAAMHIEEKSISPNIKFVWIETDQEYYILDVLNKKMSKFLQKQEFPKGIVSFIGWLVE